MDAITLKKEYDFSKGSGESLIAPTLEFEVELQAIGTIPEQGDKDSL